MGGWTKWGCTDLGYVQLLASTVECFNYRHFFAWPPYMNMRDKVVNYKTQTISNGSIALRLGSII